MMPPLAHAGHSLVQLVYVAPIIVVLVLVLVGKVRERREN